MLLSTLIILYYRFCDEVKGRIVSKFWQLHQVFEYETNAKSADGEHLLNIIKTPFENRGVPFINVIGYASDGCSTMMGVNDSVTTRFQTYSTGITILKCICHSLHLCASYACKILPRTCEDLARNVYNFFKASSKRQFKFSKFQSLLDIEIHKMLHASQTRWLSLQAVVSRMIEQWEALKQYFNEKQLVERLHTVDHVLNALNDPFVYLFYLFLDWVLPEFTNSNKLFQSEEPTIASMYDEVCNTYKELLNYYTIRDYIKKTDRHNLQSTYKERFLPVNNIYLGIKVMNFLQKPEILRNKQLKSDFLNACILFLSTSCEEIKKIFDFENPVPSELSILKPSHAISERTRISTPTLLPLMMALPRIITPDEYQVIDDEWRKLSSFELPNHINQSDDIDSFWHKLSTYDGGDQEYFSFKNLSKFALNVIALPHSNAKCERIFSAINLTKTKTRNKLVISTVNGLLLASQRVKNCTSFEPTSQEFSKMTYKILYPDYKKKPSGNKSKLNNNVQELSNNIRIELLLGQKELTLN